MAFVARELHIRGRAKRADPSSGALIVLDLRPDQQLFDMRTGERLTHLAWRNMPTAIKDLDVVNVRHILNGEEVDVVLFTIYAVWDA